ncbi:MAG: histidine phosphotransferase family protein [Cypionkella sp.]|nr:histidine phosphotransferase family protein [Cypionkella sp.]
MFDPIHLASLVGSRICHDLISPIGAISNGVELMMMDGSAALGQEMALIMESAASANARIRFFRVAFGQCAPDQRIGRSEVMSILTDGQAGSRLTIRWDSPQDLARRDVKMVFLGLLCLESALIQGGQIDAVLDDQGWAVTGRAPRIRRETGLWDALASPASADWSEISAGQVHFPLAGTRSRAPAPPRDCCGR